MVAEHEEERFVAERRTRAEDGVAEALLRILRDEPDAAPDVEDAPGVVLG